MTKTQTSGSSSLPIAEELGFRVRGVDLFPPFIEEARERAEKRGVAHLCRYEVGDIRDVLKEGGTYDVAICHQPFERATPPCLKTNPLTRVLSSSPTWPLPGWILGLLIK